MASRSKTRSSFGEEGLMPQWMSALVLVFTLLGAVVLFYYGYHIWAVLTDNIGTLHLTTDVADLDNDGDGDLDALVGNGRGVTIWTNQGGAQDGQEGFFIASPNRLRGGPATALFLSDLDDDGDLDALVGQSRRATIWWNDGQATFSRSDQRFRYDREGAPAVADFNGDARPDIFVGSQSGAYRIWFNHGNRTFNSTRPPD